MRVIGGRYHGTRLKGIRGEDFRPTTQLVKGAVLDSLYGDVQDGVFVDLFAGSGGMGIEALSRGAGRAVFVERDRRAAAVIRDNAVKCNIDPASYTIVRKDAIDYLREEASGNSTFEVIFADPPYSGDMAERVMDLVCGLDYRICRVLIIESGKVLEPEPRYADKLKRVKNYGQTHVSYFRF